MNAAVKAPKLRLNQAINFELSVYEYAQLETFFDEKYQTFWYYMNSTPRPCFTPTLLADIKSFFGSVKREIDSDEGREIEYLVLASEFEGTFNLGGDLNLFKTLIENRDAEQLQKYADACVDVLYQNVNSLNRDLTTISLVQGDALGGGFEAALSSDVLIAEKGVKMGLPEVLFNLFPGMGAYSFLSRKIGNMAAEKMILSGKLYSAEELHEMGVVDVLAEKGEGEKAVYAYIKREKRIANSVRAMRKVKAYCNPVSYEELRNITKIWVQAALNLKKKDLRMMARLIARQNGKQPSVVA